MINYKQCKTKKINKKIGIMGGTFDPIHYGHLIMAETTRLQLGLDKVLFIPTGSPPHKDNSILTSAKHRYNMVSVAIKDNSWFQLDNTEIKRECTTYTVDTLKEMHQRFCNSEIYFIIGTDTLMYIDTWKSFDCIIHLCKFVLYKRPGYRNECVDEKVEELQGKGVIIKCVEGPESSISSTYIRELIAHNKSIKYLVPSIVEQYIKKNNIYSGV